MGETKSVASVPPKGLKITYSVAPTDAKPISNKTTTHSPQAVTKEKSDKDR